MDSVYRDFFLLAFIHYSFIEWTKNEPKKEANNKSFLSVFFYIIINFSSLIFPLFWLFLLFFAFRLFGHNEQSIHMFCWSCFFSLFLSWSMSVFFSPSFSLSFSFLCMPHQTIDFVQLNEINEKTLQKKFIYDERMRELDKKNTLNRTERNRLLFIHAIRALSHTHTQCFEGAPLRALCFCGVQL